jgi:hypothetical protein
MCHQTGWVRDRLHYVCTLGQPSGSIACTVHIMDTIWRHIAVSLKGGRRVSAK